MKTRLGARASKKTLEEESKRHPNMKECSVSKGQFATFGVPNNSLKGSNFHVLGFGQWPSSDDKAHPFRSFRKGCIWIHILIVRAYFLESSDLYK